MKKIIVAIVCLSLFSISCRQEKDQKISKTLKIKGSETELSLITLFADNFKKTNNSIEVKVEGGGSQAGIEGLLDNKIQIANCSFLLGENETGKFLNKNRKLKQAIVAVDAIAIIAHPACGVNKLSLEQLSLIFTGKIKNWNQLGGSNLPIKCYGRNESSGTHRYMKHRLNIDSFSPSIQEKKDYTSIFKEVFKNPGAIGYISYANTFAKNNVNYEVVMINVYSAESEASNPTTPEVVERGEYVFIRPLFQYFDEYAKPEVVQFIKYELSVAAQELVKAKGYFPINTYHKQINMDNGLF